MTDIELKQVVADLAVNLAETDRVLRERQAETDRLLRESHAETERVLRESHAKTERVLRESHAKAERLRESQAETDRMIRATDKQIDRLRKELGGLGAKFGGFTEGMAFPSMQKILRERFGMNVISVRNIARQNGRSMEIDVLAFSNADVNEVYVVEVKSLLREEGIQQILRILREFHDFYPVHKDKKVYGILAAVDIPENLEKHVLKEGIYLARIHDETFEITVPDSFQPRAF